MIRAFRKLRQFHQAFDTADARLQETIGKPTCMAGCGLCCAHNTVSCMVIEAMDAVSTLMGSGRLQKAVAVAEGWLLEKHREAPSYEGMLVGGLIPARIRDEFVSLKRLPCPFLNDIKECTVYEARPMVCRAFGVTVTSTLLCPRPPGISETTTQFQYMRIPDMMQDMHEFKEQLRCEHREWVAFGLFPTLLYRAAREKEFRRLVGDNRIATAKVFGTEIEQNLMWQPQVDALQNGVAPERVAAMA